MSTTTTRPSASSADEAIARLHEVFRTQPRIGLVLGAGVTVGSDVPDYRSLSVRVVELGLADGGFRGRPRRITTALRRLTAGRDRADDRRDELEPDEILEIVRTYLIGGEARFHDLVKRALYEHVTVRSHRMVARSTYMRNHTLDAVISFCAARPGAGHAGPTPSVRVAPNRRVGAVLTTNYDNLVEGSFGTKYGAGSVLRPVGRRPTSSEPPPIPVFHCHGYISYVPPEQRGGVIEVSDLLGAQTDYFGAFYDQLGFGNIVATNFFRRYPALFIGSRLTDRNIRRILFQVRTERIGVADGIEHFAILPHAGPTDDLEDALLASYGVSVIRIGGFQRIPEILRDLYLSPDDVDEDEWAWVRPPSPPTHGRAERSG